MALTTYSELQAAVADWLDRTDLTSAIQDFIRLAEADMNRKVLHYRRGKRATVTADSRYTALPTDFHTLRRLYLDGANAALIPLTQPQMQDYRWRSTDSSGEPCYYTVTGDEIELYPTPDTSYTMEMSYFADLPVLSDANTSNWLLDEAPDAYLYGALVASAPYLIEDARLQSWGTLYQQAIDALNADSQRAVWGNNLAMRKRNIG